MVISYRFTRVGILVLMLSGLVSPAQEPPSAVPTQDSAQVIQFLSQTVSWYRELAVEQHLATEPADVSFLQENHRVADQVVQLAFDYARAQAQSQAKAHTPSQPQPQSMNPGGQYQALAQAAQKIEQQTQDTQTELQEARAKLAAASPAKRATLQAQVTELEGEVALLDARREVIQGMLEFVTTSSAGSRGLGLRAQIEELAQSVPASLSHSGNAQSEAPGAPLSTAANIASSRPEPAGIWGLTADLLHLWGKMRSLKTEIAATNGLRESAANLRKPLVDYLRGLVQQGDQLFAAADTSAPAQLEQQRKQLDALTAQFKQVSAGLLPLAKINVSLDLYQRTLSNWKDSVKSEARDELGQLLFRIGVLLALVGLVLALGEIWRRTTFRYVRDVRRRYQFMLLRRIVMWLAIAVIIVLTFASQLGAAVTFAGLLTAGIAVALQNVIVSVVAYFFLIGKYGLRIGDRVQISGVTGEVVDIGLVRIHIMELGGPGESQPTGRIVAFSNSIVFQPTAGIFKQIPGTNFIWHELKLTVAPETDFQAAKERIAQAVETAFTDYRASLEAQRLGMERSLSSVTLGELRARVRLHYAATGIEVSVVFPVELGKASEMDERVMKEVIDALEREPRMKLVHAELPTTTAVV